MVIFIQLYDLLDLFFCFTFINMIKVEYIFLLTHYISSVGKLQNIRTVQFLLKQ